ncbi:pullulanase X25 domain-containing protein [Paenibacillus sp. CAU 1782]
MKSITLAKDIRVAHISGNFQTQLGTASNWSPSADATLMKNIGNGTHILVVPLHPGSYEYKVAINGNWDENYGAGGEQGGGNISFELKAPKEVAFIYHEDDSTRTLSEWFEGKPDAELGSLSWAELDAWFYYDGDDLGAVYRNGGVALKLWAPKADSVTVHFYDKENCSRSIGFMAMNRGSKGVWELEARPQELEQTDLRGCFYQYEINHGGKIARGLDPYARSMAEFRTSPSGLPLGEKPDAIGKAAIVDLARTNPEGGLDYAVINGYRNREDAIIYEVHIRDFTSDPGLDGSLKHRFGTFSAFAEKLDYIASLGVTHIQLLPVMAWYYGDEAAMGERELEPSVSGNQYNWGYDPHSYFSPDGAYSANPKDPELRIRELKELIAAIHRAGMGVILDVVYTHMAKAWLLEDIVPGYYFYRKPDGKLVGGFGNNLATNHLMAEKLMVDSVRYWFKEFKIDGMRWDMMGDATFQAVQNAYNAAAKLNPRALFIGEGWRTFSGHLAEPALAGQGADQEWMNRTDDVGVFSDEFRNELKSGFGIEGEPRFLTGGARLIGRLFANLKGQPANTPADSPGDMVQYIEAHDNLTLHDVIALSLSADPASAQDEENIHRRIRLGQTLLFTAQGTAFMHAGQEYGRTKQWSGQHPPEAHSHALRDHGGDIRGYFVHNSYDSSDAINRFDWSKATDASRYPACVATRDYTIGLIALRKSTNAFRLGSMELVNRHVHLIHAPEIGEHDLLIAYRCQSTDGTGCYTIFANADSKQRTVTLYDDLTGGDVVVDRQQAGTQAIATRDNIGFTLAQDSIILEPLTAVIIRT